MWDTLIAGYDAPRVKTLVSILARHGFGDRTVSRLALQRIGNGHGGQGARLVVDGGDRPLDEVGVDEGAHRVVDQHPCRCMVCESQKSQSH